MTNEQIARLVVPRDKLILRLLGVLDAMCRTLSDLDTTDSCRHCPLNGGSACFKESMKRDAKLLGVKT